jgi:TolB protein
VSGATENPKGHEIYAIDATTGVGTLLANTRTNPAEPDRSPDGSTLIYSRSGGGLGKQIFALGPDGVERQLTTLDGGGASPIWSPDGALIAFSRSRDIYVMERDGSDVRLVADTGGSDTIPDWSPDGQRIVFLVRRGDGSDTGGIFVVTLADGSISRVTESHDDRSPAWSPTGEWISFVRFEDAPRNNLEADDSDIWLVRPDGTDAHRLLDEEGPLEVPPGGEDGGFSSSGTPDGHWQNAPAWSPDGEMLIWSDVHNGVRIANIATQEITLLTPTMWYDLAWDELGIIGTEF